MPKKRNAILDYTAYIGLRLFAMFVHMASWEANYRTARWVAGLIWWAGRRWKKLGRFEYRSKAHLRLSFPEWTEERIDRVARASLRNFVYLGIEVLFTTRLITPGRWRRHVTFGDVSESVRLLVRHDRPLIFVAGHFGNWEVVGYNLAAMGFPVYAVARPLDNPFISDYIYGIRQNRGMTILDKKGVAARAADIMEHNGCLCFIADQDAGRKGCFVDFFGRKASTYKSIALLAIRFDAPVMVGFGRRLDEEYHFAMGVRRVIHPREWADKDDPMTWLTQEYTRALEDVIRTAPEQYLWTHRRWKHRPRGEPQPEDGVA